MIRSIEIENFGKASVWSHYAKWWVERGTGDFMRAVWQPEELRRELTLRLQAIGAWGVAESLTS